MEEQQREAGHVRSAQVSPWNATRRGSARPLESASAPRTCVQLDRGVLNAGVMLVSPWRAPLPCSKVLSRKVFRIVIKGGLDLLKTEWILPMKFLSTKSVYSTR
ncbi:hypothetical protein GQ600_2137 [Phytophthora cactorum]|nr:hypothetical protein GQ600_2137 [Phytophthora cactorum]